MGCIKSQCIRLLLIITGALVLVTPFWYDRLEGEHVSSFKSQMRSRWSNIIQARKSEHLLTDVFQSLDPMSRDSYPDGMSLLFNMTKHAWEGYRTVLGADELVVYNGKENNLFGITPVGLTAISALDTLVLMGLETEYQEARDHLFKYFDITKMDHTVPILTATSELLGGFLGAYTLTGDTGLLQKARQLGELILDNFDEHVPLPILHFNYRSSRPPRPTRMNLADLGGLSLELIHLGDLLGNPKFRAAVLAGGETIRATSFPLYEIYAEEIVLGSETEAEKQPWGVPFTLGYKAGPAYEYMLKETLYYDDRDRRAAFVANKTMLGIRNNYFDHYAGEHQIVRNVHYSVTEETDQSACFAPGLVFMLTSLSPAEHKVLERRFKALIQTCLKHFYTTVGKTGVMDDTTKDYNTLRPRVAESLFIMWRQTGDTDYRKMGLAMAEAIQKEWRASRGFHFPGTTSQPSFLLADTFKYLYLLFAPRDLLSLGDYVFGTAGHPYPKNKLRTSGLGSSRSDIDIDALGPKIGKPRRRVRILKSRYEDDSFKDIL